MDHVYVCVNRNEPNTTLELSNYKKLYMQGQIVTVEIAHIWSRLCSNFTLFGALTTFTKKTRLEGYDGPPYLEGSNRFPKKTQNPTYTSEDDFFNPILKFAGSRI